MKLITRVLLACSTALLATGCKEDSGPILAPEVPLAFTRFVNAVPDTGAMDYRFVDQVEFSPVTLGLAFRGFSPYQGAAAGPRHIRVFPTSTDFGTTTSILLDTTITLEPNTYYTIVHVGYARTGQAPGDKFVVLVDARPDPAGNVAVRAMNLGTGLGAVDFFAAPPGDPLPGTPMFANVAEGAVTNYATRAPGAFAVTATPTASTTALATVTAPAGLPADPGSNLTAVGGSGQAGSALLAILMPRSVAGSAAPQSAAFTTPTVVYVVDKHPSSP